MTASLKRERGQNVPPSQGEENQCRFYAHRVVCVSLGASHPSRRNNRTRQCDTTSGAAIDLMTNNRKLLCPWCWSGAWVECTWVCESDEMSTSWVCLKTELSYLFRFENKITLDNLTFLFLYASACTRERERKNRYYRHATCEAGIRPKILCSGFIIYQQITTDCDVSFIQVTRQQNRYSRGSGVKGHSTGRFVPKTRCLL